MARSKKRQALIDGVADHIRRNLQDTTEVRHDRGMKLLKALASYGTDRELQRFCEYYGISLEKGVDDA